MHEEYERLTFGRYLKAKRQQVGLDLEEVSSETKIGMDMLNAIETEDHARFPEDVYLKGFLRSYSRLVDADEDAVVRNYLESRREFQDIRESDEVFAREQQNFWPRILMGIGVLLGVIVISVLAISLFRDGSGPGKEEKPVSSPGTEINDNAPADEANEEGAPEEEAFSQPNTNPGPEAFPEDKGSNISAPAEENEAVNTRSSEENLYAETFSEQASVLQLTMEALEVTWLKVIIDGKATRELSLKPGDKVTLGASEKYNLLIGNAGGLRLELNGNPVAIPGKSGQVVNLVLP